MIGGTHYVSDDGEHIDCASTPHDDCRIGCLEGCETWPCGHPLGNLGYCWATEHTNAAELRDSYLGADEDQHSPVPGAPVELHWDGDCVLWDYPESERP